MNHPSSLHGLPFPHILHTAFPFSFGCPFYHFYLVKSLLFHLLFFPSWTVFLFLLYRSFIFFSHKSCILLHLLFLFMNHLPLFSLFILSSSLTMFIFLLSSMPIHEPPLPFYTHHLSIFYNIYLSSSIFYSFSWTSFPFLHSLSLHLLQWLSPSTSISTLLHERPFPFYAPPVASHFFLHFFLPFSRSLLAPPSAHSLPASHHFTRCVFPSAILFSFLAGAPFPFPLPGSH